MAKNPSTYNKGGIYRYVDYVSQLPEFLRAEDDVVVFLQVLSDYINNAYRNITVVEQFKFSFACVDSNYASIQNKVNNLITLFKKAELREQKMLYLSKPQGNKYDTSRPFIVDYIEYAGNYDQLDASAINVSTAKDGDKVYVKFLKDEYATYSGVFIYVTGNGSLIPDPLATSQDPFTNTQNEPIITSLGLVPRILQFNVKDISDIHVRPATTVDNIIYYEVFFYATIYNVESITSIDDIEYDINSDGSLEKILIDYYNTITTLASAYQDHLFLKFVNDENSFDWTSDYGSGLFYAREMTSEQRSQNKNNTILTETFVDPIYSLTSNEMAIQKIYSDGASVTVIITGSHSFSMGDSIYITHTETFNGKYTILDIVSANTFKLNPLSTNISAHSEVGGVVVASNLFYSKNVNDFTKSQLKLIYTQAESSDIESITNGDVFYRVTSNQYDDFETDVNCTSVNTSANSLSVYDVSGLILGDVVFFMFDTGSSITGLSTNTPYTIQSINTTTKSISLNGVSFSASGIGTAKLIKANLYVSSSNTTTENYTVNHTDTLNVGDYVKATTLASSTTPTGFSDTNIYVITSVDKTNNTVEISDVYPTVSAPMFRLVKYTKDMNSYGVVDYQNIKQTTGEVILKSYIGDMISDGYFVKNDSSTLPATLYVNAISTIWNADTMYKTGTFVTFNNIRYRTLLDNKGKKPTDETYFIVDMTSLLIYATTVEYNPYMFGLYNTKALAFGDSIDYTKGFNVLGNTLSIQKEQDFSLKYGAYQREFIYNPRFATNYITTRNGYMEIIKGNDEYDAVSGDISKYIQANTQESMMLYGSNVTKVFNISKISKSNGIVTLVTDQKHGYETGIFVTVTGIVELDYNGKYQITILSPNSFTYNIDDLTTGTGTTLGSTVSYSSDIICTVESIIRSSNVVTVTTSTTHGYNIGTPINITGCVQPDYNGAFTVSSVDPTNPLVFTYNINTQKNI